MKDETGVRISEFLDGELSANELDQLIADVENSEVQQSLKNYTRIRHALRGESDSYASIDVSLAVAEAIKDLEFDAEDTVSHSVATTKSWFSAHWFKPALGAAFASVVAIVTVVVNQNAIVATNPAATPQVAQQNVAPKTYNLAEFARSSSEIDTAKVKDVAAREELNQYLVNHARSASGNNYQGMVPYVRAVAYEPGQDKK